MIYSIWRGNPDSSGHCEAGCEQSCSGNWPVCMDLAPNIHLAHKLPNGMDFFNPEFGPACTSGFKVLCGPKGSPTAPGVWMPSCGGTCPQSCSDKTPWPVCQDLTYSSSLAQVDPEHFGPECTTGRRARCGVTGSTVFPYWWGGPDDNTKPGCAQAWETFATVYKSTLALCTFVSLVCAM